MDRLIARMRSPLMAYAILGLLLIGAAIEAGAWFQNHGLEAAIAEPARIQVGDDTPELLIFAKAWELARTGERREALRLYGAILNSENPELRRRVRYNLGTQYLEDAAALWNARGVLEYVRVNTLIASAKENLREALRLDPGDWNARYNLEYAYRITPPPKERAKSDFRGSKSSVFATLPAIPGGGP